MGKDTFTSPLPLLLTVDDLVPTPNDLHRVDVLLENLAHISIGSKDKLNNDSRLVHALVERWWPSTQTFHFPCGELSFTQLDYVMQTAHPCGIKINLPYDDKYSNVDEASKLLSQITNNYIKYRNITLVFLKMYMRNLDSRETNYTYNLQLEIVYARGLAAYMMGNLFFTNNSTSLA
ncbi:hypothetical protein GIB67_039907, partial [Kingdonia uniflora]